MTVRLFNRNPVAMSCEVTSQALIVRITDDQPEVRTLETGETVLIELDPPSPPQEPETTVTVRAELHDAYVWEETPSGYARWSRDSSGNAYRTYIAPADATLQVVALTSGSPPPTAPPTPGSGTAILKVKVRKKGDL
jgi:hypothetical protein